MADGFNFDRVHYQWKMPDRKKTQFNDHFRAIIVLFGQCFQDSEGRQRLLQAHAKLFMTLAMMSQVSIQAVRFVFALRWLIL